MEVVSPVVYLTEVDLEASTTGVDMALPMVAMVEAVPLPPLTSAWVAVTDTPITATQPSMAVTQPSMAVTLPSLGTDPVIIGNNLYQFQEVMFHIIRKKKL